MPVFKMTWILEQTFLEPERFKILEMSYNKSFLHFIKQWKCMRRADPIKDQIVNTVDLIQHVVSAQLDNIVIELWK